MSRVISFRDLMLCSKLSHIKNEVELLQIKNDDIVASILAQIGFDIDYPVTYIPTKHRDMQNKIAVGFQAVGEISLNRSFLNSGLCSATERLVIASYADPSFMRELARLSGNHVNYKSMLEDETEFDGDELPEDMLEPDRDLVAGQIKLLVELRDNIRGNLYNEAGDVKTYAEYKETVNVG